MKKLLSLLGVGMLVAMWSGCGVTNPASSVTITIDAIGAVAVGGGAGQVTGKIETDSVLTLVTMKVLSGSTDVTSKFTVSFTSAYQGKKSADLKTDMSTTITALSTATAATYTLSITAEAGSITSTSTKDFTVTGNADPLLTVTGSGTVFNLIGPSAGAYDLVLGANVSSSGSATTKDLKDITTIAAPEFSGALSSGNATLFAVSTTAAYDAATKTTVKTAGDAAALTTTAALRANDVVVAKLGGSRGYAIIKVTAYTPDGASDNVGKLEFEYKFTTGL